MRGYTCATCGGDLSPYGAGGLYKCNFCGKLYAEEKEIPPLQASRMLRSDGNKEAAIALLEEHVAKNNDPVCIRELLLTELDIASISRYIDDNSLFLDNLHILQGNRWYRKLRNHTSDEVREFIGLVDSYTDTCTRRDDIQKNLSHRIAMVSDAKNYGGMNPVVCGILFAMFLGAFLLMPLIFSNPVLGISVFLGIGVAGGLLCHVSNKMKEKEHLKKKARQDELCHEAYEARNEAEKKIESISSEIRTMEEEIFTEDK